MYQADRGDYRTNESMSSAFRHSCLGRLLIFGGILLILLLIAYITAPTEKEMQAEMSDNIMQCLEENDSIKGDGIDDFVNNIGFIFTKADSTKVTKEVRDAYRTLNRLESYRHNFFSTSYIYNNMRPEGVRVGIGLFYVVIPTVNYKDILLDVGPVHKGYEQKLIRQVTIEPDLGKTPNIQEFHYKRNPDD